MLVLVFTAWKCCIPMLFPKEIQQALYFTSWRFPKKTSIILVLNAKGYHIHMLLHDFYWACRYHSIHLVLGLQHFHLKIAIYRA